MYRRAKEIFSQSTDFTFNNEMSKMLHGKWGDKTDKSVHKISFSEKWSKICDGKDIVFGLETAVTYDKRQQRHDLRLKFSFTDDGVKILQGLDEGGIGADLIVIHSHAKRMSKRSFDLSSINDSEWGNPVSYNEYHIFHFEVVRHLRDNGPEPDTQPLPREELEHISDIEIRAGSKTFKCHKVLLAKNSSVFNAMFKHSCVEMDSGIIQIEDFEGDTVAAFIAFIYEGRFEDEARYTVQLLGMANKYEVKALKEACAKHLASDIKKENIVEVWKAAELCQMPQLLGAVQEFLKKNWSSRGEMPGINDVLKNHPMFVCDLVTYFDYQLKSAQPKK